MPKKQGWEEYYFTSQTYPTVDERFSHIHIDFLGPLPYSNGYSYLLTIIDRYTKFPQAVPLAEITTENLINALLSHWISIFGVPLALSSDRGSQFTSKLFQDFLSNIGTKHIMTSSYNPHANGEIESFHRRLKASLMTYGDSSNWSVNLPLCLLK